MLNRMRMGGTRGNVVLLLQPGADDVAIVDKSSAGRAVTTVGSVALSTTSIWPGFKSIAFTGGHLKLPSAADFGFPGDYLLEAVLQMAALPSSYYVWFANETSGGLSSTISGTGFTLGRSLVGTQLTVAQGFDALTPYYLAARRIGDKTEMFVNAVPGASSTTIATSYPQGAPTIGVDGDGSTRNLIGHLFALRISQGAQPVLGGPFSP